MWVAMQEITLYTTSACHLCEVAEALVRPLLPIENYCLSLVEISDSDALVDQYGLRIPVLAATASALELDWPFDEKAVSLFLRSLVA